MQVGLPATLTKTGGIRSASCAAGRLYIVKPDGGEGAAMIGKVLSLFGGKWVAIVILAYVATLTAGSVYLNSKNKKLHASLQAAEDALLVERTAHNATRILLTEALRNLDIAREALAKEQKAAESIRGSLRDALKREAEAVSMARSRKQILDAVRTVPRKPAEAHNVIDTNSRISVADWLNRGL